MDATSVVNSTAPSHSLAPPSLAATSIDVLRRRAIVLALASLLIIALGLRLYGINWDDGSDFSLHPDERSIIWTAQQLSPNSLKDPSELFDVEQSSLVPRSPNRTTGHGVYDYGSFPFYLLESSSWLVGLLPGVDKGDLYTMTIIGRVFSALMDTGTILVVFFIGRRLFNPRVGLLAAAFVTFAVIHIQLSHFYTTDVMMTFFGALSFLFLIGVAREGRRRDAALAGIFFGLALATKFSMASMLPAVFIAPALYALRGDDSRVHSWTFDRERLRVGLKALGVTLALVALVFVLAQPYVLLDIKHYADDAYQQSQMVRREIDFPYTRQYDNSLPFVYHIWQFSVWGVGLPLGLLMWAGLGFTVVVAAKRRRKADLLLLAWVLPFFLITGLAEVKFLRYLLPITPFLAIMAARLALDSLRWLKGRHFYHPSLPYKAGVAGIGLVIVATAFYAFAFTNVYTDTHPAVQVSSYVKTNLPRGTTLIGEHWEESLPGLYGYSQVNLQLYDSDTGIIRYRDHLGREVTGTKEEHLADQLANSDYLVLFSSRLYSTIPRLPERYPLSSRYYQLLFDGDLGFEVERVGQAYPNFLGVSFVNDTFARPGLTPPQKLTSINPTPLTINLGYADDSYVNYEHPMTILFKKVRPMGEEELRAVLATGKEPELLPRGGLLSPEDARRQQEGGTFSELFDRNSLANRFPVLTWLLAVELISLVTLPAGLLLLRRLPDRGYLLIKALGLLLVAYLTWLLASLHWLPFSVGTLWLSILLVAAVSGLALFKAREEILEFVRKRWKFLLFCEVLFLVAFLVFYGLRVWNPDLWHWSKGGEKPMDFAYLNAVVKSTYMPAYDPWFSGAHLNYYYFGQFIIASLIKLTGVLPSTAFNLAIPLLFALTIGGAFSVVYNLAAATRRGGEEVGQPSRRGLSPVAAGLVAAVFVAIIGNMDGVVQLVQGVWRVTFRDMSFEGFDFWRSSRMINTATPLDCGGCEITEFPFFSFLYADLHAHLIALPFAMLAIGIALSLVLGARHGSDRWLQWIGLGALALTVGVLFTINSWDYPTYLTLAVVLVVLAEYLRHRRFSIDMVVGGIVKAGLLVVLSLLLLAPFHANYEGSVKFPWLTGNEFRTPLHEYLAIHGIFLFIVLSFLLYRLFRTYNVFAWRSQGGVMLGARGPGWLQYLRHRGTLRPLYLIFSAALLIALAVEGLHTVAFLALILLLIAPLVLRYLMAREENSPVELFAFALLGMALLLGIGVELFRVDIVDPGRMNTVFKFYFHAWVLFAMASAYLLWRLDFGKAMVALKRWRGLWMVALAALVAVGMIYPIAATPDRSRVRFNPSPTTVDGMAYMKDAVYYDEGEGLELKWDYQALLWLQDNIQGSPVILEGNTPLYRWGNRVSIYTGLPTIIGWDWHQTQQRGDTTPGGGLISSAIAARRSDVGTLYRTPSITTAQELLSKYNVSYIYVGQLERLYYPEDGISKFEEMAGQGLLEVVYPGAEQDNPEVSIYGVTG